MYDRQSEMLPAVRTFSVALITFLCIVTDASAHGINFEISQRSPVVTVYAYFSSTSPVGDASVTIMAPGLDQPWQTGRTDKSGHFAFLPDQIGEWRIMVDDERGHRRRSMVTISRIFFNEDRYESKVDVVHPDHVEKIDMEKKLFHQMPFIYRIAFGLSIIFGITGVWYGLTARKALRNEKTIH